VPVEVMSLKPANLSFEEAAAVPMAAVTALQGLRHHGEVQAGQRVLINGASGGIGTFAVQIAKSFGCEVTGVTSTRNIDLVGSLGADHVVDYTRTDFFDSGRRCDLILDTIGNLSVRDLRRALTEGGKAAVVGFTSVVKLIGVSLRGGKDIAIVSAHVATADLELLSHLIEAGKSGPPHRPALSVRRNPRSNHLPGTRPRQREGRRRRAVRMCRRSALLPDPQPPQGTYAWSTSTSLPRVGASHPCQLPGNDSNEGEGPQADGLAVRLPAVLIGACVGRRSVLCRAPSAVRGLGCIGVWKVPLGDDVPIRGESNPSRR
jgi:Zinc-binding dehydrogenase